MTCDFGPSSSSAETAEDVPPATRLDVKTEQLSCEHSAQAVTSSGVSMYVHTPEGAGSDECDVVREVATPVDGPSWDAVQLEIPARKKHGASKKQLRKLRHQVCQGVRREVYIYATVEVLPRSWAP